MNQSVSLCLQRIIHEIIPLSSFTSGIGLLNGKMGISILLHHYSRHTMDSEIEKYARYLTNEICERIFETPNLDFDNGLIGIGWGMERLVADGYWDGDTDEKLKKIDHAIWGETGLCRIKGYKLAGVGLYILTRRFNSKQSALWEHRISNWINDIDKIVGQPEVISKSQFLILTLYCLSVYLQSGMFIHEINKLWEKLSVLLDFGLQWTTCISEKNIINDLCVSMEQKGCLSFQRELYPVSEWQPTLTDINRFYLYKFLCERMYFQTPDVYREKINALVSDRNHTDYLLKLINPENTGLQSYVGGFAWSLLQWSISSSLVNNER